MPSLGTIGHLVDGPGIDVILLYKLEIGPLAQRVSATLVHSSIEYIQWCSICSSILYTVYVSIYRIVGG